MLPAGLVIPSEEKMSRLAVVALLALGILTSAMGLKAAVSGSGVVINPVPRVVINPVPRVVINPVPR
jgi:hypothetical protein